MLFAEEKTGVGGWLWSVSFCGGNGTVSYWS